MDWLVFFSTKVEKHKIRFKSMLWLAAPGPSMQKHFTEGKVSHNSQQRPQNGPERHNA